MTSSPPPTGGELVHRPDAAESQLSSVVFDLSQNVQAAMDNMLKLINEIDQNSASVVEEIEKSKDSALQRKKTLEEEKNHFQKAAFSVIDLLSGRDLA